MDTSYKHQEGRRVCIWHNCIPKEVGYFSNGPDDVGRWQRATFISSRGPLLDWFGQIMLYSHWSTQTWCSTNTCVLATDEAVVCTLIEHSNAGAY